jgi:hypothetical protein
MSRKIALPRPEAEDISLASSRSHHRSVSELWFAKIKRDVIARGIFTSVPDLAHKLRRYINAYSARARLSSKRKGRTRRGRT